MSLALWVSFQQHWIVFIKIPARDPTVGLELSMCVLLYNKTVISYVSRQVDWGEAVVVAQKKRRTAGVASFVTLNSDDTLVPPQSLEHAASIYL